MNYVTLTPEVFFDEDGGASMRYLSQYCQLPTTNKFIYDGNINADYPKNLLFPNIVKANTVYTSNIANKFPDLEELKNIAYYLAVIPEINIPDIGNLKSVDRFYINTAEHSISLSLGFIKKYFTIIDENTLIINGKELNVVGMWHIGSYSYENYKEFGL